MEPPVVSEQRQAVAPVVFPLVGSVEMPYCHHGAIGYGCQGMTALAIQVNPQMPAVAGFPSDLLAKCPNEIAISAPSTRTVAARSSTCCKATVHGSRPGIVQMIDSPTSSSR
jgi:hypothetical protein